MDTLPHLADALSAAMEGFFGAKPSNPRSGRWPTVRDRHLDAHPECAVCRRRENLNVHHLKPYHLFPELELEPGNLLTLCEGGAVNCHLLFGHLLRWDAWNPHCREDAEFFSRKIVCREIARPRVAFGDGNDEGQLG